MGTSGYLQAAVTSAPKCLALERAFRSLGTRLSRSRASPRLRTEARQIDDALAVSTSGATAAAAAMGLAGPVRSRFTGSSPHAAATSASTTEQSRTRRFTGVITA